jgi:hypothetical protein
MHKTVTVDLVIVSCGRTEGEDMKSDSTKSEYRRNKLREETENLQCFTMCSLHLKLLD